MICANGCPLPQPYTKAELSTSVVQRTGDGGGVVQQQLQISATDNVRRVQRFVSWVVRPAGTGRKLRGAAKAAGGVQDQPIIIEGWALGEYPGNDSFIMTNTRIKSAVACRCMQTVVCNPGCRRGAGAYSCIVAPC
jgi:ribosomal protein S28E/S33